MVEHVYRVVFVVADRDESARAAQADANITLSHLRTEQKVLGVLTAEQRSKLAAHRQAMQEVSVGTGAVSMPGEGTDRRGHRPCRAVLDHASDRAARGCDRRPGQRTAHDLGSLRWNAELSSSAWLKAQDMCDRDYWSHTNPDGEKAWGLIAAEGYDYRFVGENLAKGYDTESQIVDAWMESTTHRETMLNPVYEDVGYAQIRCEFQGTERIVAVSHYGTLH